MLPLAIGLLTGGVAHSAPITILGGFLGAGKTTAVRAMLDNRQQLKIAVCVNDLASVNVDAATLRRRSVDEDGVATIELQNGCACCSASEAPWERRQQQTSECETP